MKRPLLLSLSLLAAGLSSCGPSVPAGPPASLGLVVLGAEEAGVAFAGTTSWTVKNVPGWLKLNQRTGAGAVSLRASVPPTMFLNTTSLRGQFTIEWEASDRSGTTLVDVNADLSPVMTRATGQVVAPDVAGADAREDGTVNTAKAASTAGDAPDGVLVKYKTASSAVRAQALGALASAAGPRLALLRTADVDAALRRLRADPNVEYAVPNVRLRALGTPGVVPNDQYAPLQWPFRLMNYPAVWRDMETQVYPNAVTVAVLDSGVRFDHPDLAGALWTSGEGAFDFVDGDADPTDEGTPGVDDGSHGTHVTGIIAARWGKLANVCPTCSDSGVVGAVYKAPVKVLPLRVLGADGGTLEDVAAAVRYAAGVEITRNGQKLVNPHPAKVINLSLGGPVSAATARPLCEAVKEAADAGALIVAAGGNDGDTAPYYPAACDGAVAVASVTLGDTLPKRATYSNTYGQIALAAPGGDVGGFNGASFNARAFPDLVFSTSWDYTKNRPIYEAMAGTSQASPQVAALAALLLSKGVVSTAAEARQRLIDTATDLGAAGRDSETGFGLVNAAAALNAPAVTPALEARVRRGTGEDTEFLRLDLDAVGRFSAILPKGAFTLEVREDTGGNGIVGDASDRTLARPFSAESATTDLGTLRLP